MSGEDGPLKGDVCPSGPATPFGPPSCWGGDRDRMMEVGSGGSRRSRDGGVCAGDSVASLLGAIDVERSPGIGFRAGRMRSGGDSEEGERSEGHEEGRPRRRLTTREAVAKKLSSEYRVLPADAVNLMVLKRLKLHRLETDPFFDPEGGPGMISSSTGTEGAQPDLTYNQAAALSLSLCFVQLLTIFALEPGLFNLTRDFQTLSGSFFQNIVPLWRVPGEMIRQGEMLATEHAITNLLRFLGILLFQHNIFAFLLERAKSLLLVCAIYLERAVEERGDSAVGDKKRWLLVAPLRLSVYRDALRAGDWVFFLAAWGFLSVPLLLSLVAISVINERTNNNVGLLLSGWFAVYAVIDMDVKLLRLLQAYGDTSLDFSFPHLVPKVLRGTQKRSAQISEELTSLAQRVAVRYMSLLTMVFVSPLLVAFGSLGGVHLNHGSTLDCVVFGVVILVEGLLHGHNWVVPSEEKRGLLVADLAVAGGAAVLWLQGAFRSSRVEFVTTLLQVCFTSHALLTGQWPRGTATGGQTGAQAGREGQVQDERGGQRGEGVKGREERRWWKSFVGPFHWMVILGNVSVLWISDGWVEVYGEDGRQYSTDDAGFVRAGFSVWLLGVGLVPFVKKWRLTRKHAALAGAVPLLHFAGTVACSLLFAGDFFPPGLSLIRFVSLAYLSTIPAALMFSVAVAVTEKEDEEGMVELPPFLSPIDDPTGPHAMGLPHQGEPSQQGTVKIDPRYLMQMHMQIQRGMSGGLSSVSGAISRLRSAPLQITHQQSALGGGAQQKEREKDKAEGEVGADVIFTLTSGYVTVFAVVSILSQEDITWVAVVGYSLYCSALFVVNIVIVAPLSPSLSLSAELSALVSSLFAARRRQSSTAGSPMQGGEGSGQHGGVEVPLVPPTRTDSVRPLLLPFPGDAVQQGDLLLSPPPLLPQQSPRGFLGGAGGESSLQGQRREREGGREGEEQAEEGGSQAPSRGGGVGGQSRGGAGAGLLPLSLPAPATSSSTLWESLFKLLDRAVQALYLLIFSIALLWVGGEFLGTNEADEQVCLFLVVLPASFAVLKGALNALGLGKDAAGAGDSLTSPSPSAPTGFVAPIAGVLRLALAAVSLVTWGSCMWDGWESVRDSAFSFPQRVAVSVLAVGILGVSAPHLVARWRVSDEEEEDAEGEGIGERNANGVPLQAVLLARQTSKKGSPIWLQRLRLVRRRFIFGLQLVVLSILSSFSWLWGTGELGTFLERTVGKGTSPVESVENIVVAACLSLFLALRTKTDQRKKRRTLREARSKFLFRRTRSLGAGKRNSPSSLRPFRERDRHGNLIYKRHHHRDDHSSMRGGYMLRSRSASAICCMPSPSAGGHSSIAATGFDRLQSPASLHLYLGDREAEPEAGASPCAPSRAKSAAAAGSRRKPTLEWAQTPLKSPPLSQRDRQGGTEEAGRLPMTRPSPSDGGRSRDGPLYLTQTQSQAQTGWRGPPGVSLQPRQPHGAVGGDLASPLPPLSRPTDRSGLPPSATAEQTPLPASSRPPVLDIPRIEVEPVEEERGEEGGEVSVETVKERESTQEGRGRLSWDNEGEREVEGEARQPSNALFFPPSSPDVSRAGSPKRSSVTERDRLLLESLPPVQSERDRGGTHSGRIQAYHLDWRFWKPLWCPPQSLLLSMAFVLLLLSLLLLFFLLWEEGRIQTWWAQRSERARGRPKKERVPPEMRRRWKRTQHPKRPPTPAPLPPLEDNSMQMQGGGGELGGDLSAGGVRDLKDYWRRGDGGFRQGWKGKRQMKLEQLGTGADWRGVGEKSDGEGGAERDGWKWYDQAGENDSAVSESAATSVSPSRPSVGDLLFSKQASEVRGEGDEGRNQDSSSEGELKSSSFSSSSVGSGEEEGEEDRKEGWLKDRREEESGGDLVERGGERIRSSSSSSTTTTSSSSSSLMSSPASFLSPRTFGGQHSVGVPFSSTESFPSSSKNLSENLWRSSDEEVVGEGMEGDGEKSGFEDSKEGAFLSSPSSSGLPRGATFFSPFMRQRGEGGKRTRDLEVKGSKSSDDASWRAPSSQSAPSFLPSPPDSADAASLPREISTGAGEDGVERTGRRFDVSSSGLRAGSSSEGSFEEVRGGKGREYKGQNASDAKERWQRTRDTNAWHRRDVERHQSSADSGSKDTENVVSPFSPFTNFPLEKDLKSLV